MAILFIECKTGDAESSKGLRYLKSVYPKVRAVQVHLKGKKEYLDRDGIEHCHASRFLKDMV